MTYSGMQIWSREAWRGRLRLITRWNDRAACSRRLLRNLMADEAPPRGLRRVVAQEFYGRCRRPRSGAPGVRLEAAVRMRDRFLQRGREVWEEDWASTSQLATATQGLLQTQEAPRFSRECVLRRSCRNDASRLLDPRLLARSASPSSAVISSSSTGKTPPRNSPSHSRIKAGHAGGLRLGQREVGVALNDPSLSRQDLIPRCCLLAMAAGGGGVF